MLCCSFLLPKFSVINQEFILAGGNPGLFEKIDQFFHLLSCATFPGSCQKFLKVAAPGN